MSDFEVYERTDAWAAKGPSLTITAHGTLNINGPALDALGKPEAVILLYARNEAVIGLRPASKDESDCYPLHRIGHSAHMRMLRAGDYLAWIGADLSETRRYPLTVEDGIGCVRLRGPSRIVMGNRSRRGKKSGEH